MLNFLRKLRRNNMKNSKYLQYAVGEIILVVIGILIAVGINNLNEDLKKEKKRDRYRTNLIDELKADLRNLDQRDSLERIYIESIEDYLNYYVRETFNYDTLIEKLENRRSTKNYFVSNTLTIDDMLSTGNIDLFDEVVRKTIIDLKTSLELNEDYVKKTVDLTIPYEREFRQSIDLVHESFDTREHISVQGWKRNIDSKQYLLLNNMMMNQLGLHNYQIVVHERIRVKAKRLIEKLKQSE